MSEQDDMMDWCNEQAERAKMDDPERLHAQIAALTERLRIVEAERDEAKAALSTEREMREAAEAYIAAIPAMCKGDYSAPCALHVRAPIEALRAELERKDAALKFYADEANWKHSPRGSDFYHEADADCGDIARAAPTPQQSGDGPWPKFVKTFEGNLCMFTGPSQEQGRFFGARGYSGVGYSGWTSCDFKGVCELSGNAEISEAEAAQWLEAHGHKDVAAQLRGKVITPPHADVATGGGRV